MSRKQKFDGGTANELAQAAAKEFFEKGFDGTSMRSIADAAGCEAGLIYYYYRTKDDLFSAVLERFFDPYKADFEKLTEEAKTKPYRALYRFFAYMKSATREFREKYSANMHRTVRWAIREQTLTVIEPYIERIIEILMTFGAKPRLAPKPMAVFLSHGVGSVILHEDADRVDEITDDMRKTVNLLMGLDEETSRKMFEQASPVS